MIPKVSVRLYLDMVAGPWILAILIFSIVCVFVVFIKKCWLLRIRFLAEMLIYEGRSSKKFTWPPLSKLRVCWGRNVYQMKDTFIRNRKVLHHEPWISNSLASTQPDREITLWTPNKLLWALLLEAPKNFFPIF